MCRVPESKRVPQQYFAEGLYRRHCSPQQSREPLRATSASEENSRIRRPARVVHQAQQACLILRLDNIVGKLSDRESNPKFYFVDTGLIELLKQDNLSDQLENLVAIELLRRYGREEAVFFYKRDIEGDFYIPEEKIGIQVCVRLGTDPDTIAREIGAFDKMEKEVELKRRIIITSDEEKTLRCDMGDITVIPAWKWLLDVERKA